jgi:hypothetical protein
LLERVCIGDENHAKDLPSEENLEMEKRLEGLKNVARK